MARPRNADLAALAELRHQIDQVRLDGSPFGSAWLPALSSALGLDTGLMYSVRTEPEGHRLGWCVGEKVPVGPEALRHELDSMFRKSPGRWGVYNPDRPERPQRNRALAFEPAAGFKQVLRRSPATLRKLGVISADDLSRAKAGFNKSAALFERVGLHRAWQLRMLVCDDHTLLGWVGGFRAEQPGARELWMLQALGPELSRRLRLERLFANAPLLESALTACLEQVHRPAFVVDPAGAVLYANSLGRLAFDRSSQTAVALAEAVRAGRAPAGCSLTPLRAVGLPPHFLVVGPGQDAATDQVALARLRYGLTPRQTEVFAALVQGHPTRVIAADLDCADRTVEAHITAILDKLGVDSRAAAVARIWGLR